jgi:hypothetical protein
MLGGREPPWLLTAWKSWKDEVSCKSNWKTDYSVYNKQPTPSSYAANTGIMLVHPPLSLSRYRKGFHTHSGSCMRLPEDICGCKRNKLVYVSHVAHKWLYSPTKHYGDIIRYVPHACTLKNLFGPVPRSKHVCGTTSYGGLEQA